jgi:hypothetical protein
MNWAIPLRHRGHGERKHPLLLVEDRAARHDVGEPSRVSMRIAGLGTRRLRHRGRLRDLAEHRVDLADEIAVLGLLRQLHRRHLVPCSRRLRRLRRWRF